MNVYEKKIAELERENAELRNKIMSAEELVNSVCGIGYFDTDTTSETHNDKKETFNKMLHNAVICKTDDEINRLVDICKANGVEWFVVNVDKSLEFHVNVLELKIAPYDTLFKHRKIFIIHEKRVDVVQANQLPTYGFVYGETLSKKCSILYAKNLIHNNVVSIEENRIIHCADNKEVEWFLELMDSINKYYEITFDRCNHVYTPSYIKYMANDIHRLDLYFTYHIEKETDILKVHVWRKDDIAYPEHIVEAKDIMIKEEN